MSDDKLNQDYSDPIEIYRRKKSPSKTRSEAPGAEKMATVVRLRDFERALENVRKANRAKRATKEITIRIKTR